MEPEQDKTQTIFRQVLINTLSNYGGKIVTLGVWFFLTPYILSKLGQSVYGMWVIVGSLVSYGSLLDFGIANAITKYVAEYHAKEEYDQAHSLVATALWLYTIVGLAAILLGAILAPILPHIFNIPVDQRTTFSWLILLSGIGLGISLPSAAPISVLRGLHRFDVINLISISGMLLLAGSMVLVLHLGGGALGLVMVNIMANLLMQVPAIWLIRRNARKLNFGYRGAKRSLLKTVAGYSSALFVISIAGQLKVKTDEVVVGTFLTISDVTPYSIAHRLSDIPQMLTDQFMKVLMPLSSRLHSENDHGRLRQLYLISTRLTMAMFLPLGLGAVILAKPFLTAWVGSAYAPYSGLVLLLISASFFDTLMWPANAILQGMAKHRVLAYAAIISGVVNLLISIALVKPLGLAGVALGTLIPTSLECVFYVLPYSMRVVEIDIRTVLKDIFLPVAIPSVSMAAVLGLFRYLIHPNGMIPVLAIGAGSLVVYAAVYLVIGSKSQEKSLFQGLFQNMINSLRIRASQADAEK